MTRSDAIIILLMLILLSLVYSKYWVFDNEQSSDHYAQVTITNLPKQKISLHQDKIYTFAGRIGDTKIQVKNNRIRFINSPCHKKYCIHSGWLANAGSIAACVPNGVSVVIKNLNIKYDAINF